MVKICFLDQLQVEVLLSYFVERLDLKLRRVGHPRQLHHFFEGLNGAIEVIRLLQGFAHPFVGLHHPAPITALFRHIAHQTEHLLGISEHVKAQIERAKDLVGEVEQGLVDQRLGHCANLHHIWDYLLEDPLIKIIHNEGQLIEHPVDYLKTLGVPFSVVDQVEVREVVLKD